MFRNDKVELIRCKNCGNCKYAETLISPDSESDWIDSLIRHCKKFNTDVITTYVCLNDWEPDEEYVEEYNHTHKSQKCREIAINVGNGGFNLSIGEFDYYIKKCGYTDIKYVTDDEKFITYDEVLKHYDENESLAYCYIIQYAIGYVNNKKYNISFFDLERDDPVLIKVIRKFDHIADRSIISIPSNVDWELCEADNGAEWIAEKHRTWS